MMKKRAIYLSFVLISLFAIVFLSFFYLPELILRERIHIKIYLTVNGKECDTISTLFLRSQFEGEKSDNEFVVKEKDGAYYFDLSGRKQGNYNIKFQCDSDTYQGNFKKVPILGISYDKLKSWYVSNIECNIDLRKEDGKWIAAYDVDYTELGRGNKNSYIVRDNKVLINGGNSLICFGI